MIESYIEAIINSRTTEDFPVVDGYLSSVDNFVYNSAKRLVIAFQKYQKKQINIDALLILIRNYLLVCQNEIELPAFFNLDENEYGIIKSASGKYYAALDIPKYIDTDFVNQAYQRKGVLKSEPDQSDVFYGTNKYIYQLTKYKRFKSLEQKLAVFGALNTPEGYTTLVSLPTGGGKSLITQTMAYQQNGLTIVIVPTVSLAIDQVRNAKNNIKHPTDKEIFCYYSRIEVDRKNALRNAIQNETARLLFISPEALIRNTDFDKMISQANKKKYLKNLIIDEAHIVIEWGDFFRVDYQCLEPWRRELLANNSLLRTVLLSATYTRNAVENLKQMFSTPDKWIEIRCDALRREPKFAVVKANSYTDKKNKMIELVKKLPHPMIVYTNSPKEAENIKSILVSEGIDNLETFTGATKAAERERIIKDWTDDKIDLIIATSAFGVGVDKPDVRTVLHLYIPDTPNQYYQELGRGGRDGLVSLSVMCINPKDDIDSAYNRVNTVLKAETIWGRWLSMYKSPTSIWKKGMVTLDTNVKPVYNLTGDEDDEASKMDIQWNVYVILLLRRHNLISVKSMIYDSQYECYKMRVEILDDDLRNEGTDAPQIIKDIRDREADIVDKGIKHISRAIEYNERLCWSEMFNSTYDKVAPYCGGCGKHHNPEMMNEGEFPLLIPVREPCKSISAELKKLTQDEKEVLVLGDVDDYSIVNRFLQSGVSVIVVNDTNLDDNFDLILNMSGNSNTMILGIREYKELCSLPAEYYVSGGVVALYNSTLDAAYHFCIALRKNRKQNMKLIHIANKDYENPGIHKPLSAVIEGPRIEDYILERM